MSDLPRELTDDERRWVKRLERTLDAMPNTLKGFHSPGSISFFDRGDEGLHDAEAGTAERQEGIIETISPRALGWIDAGDW